MTHDDRIANLETEIGALKARALLIESEHRSLLTEIAKELERRDTLRDEISETLRLAADYNDERLTEALTAKGSGDGVSKEMFMEAMQTVFSSLRDLMIAMMPPSERKE